MAKRTVTLDIDTSAIRLMETRGEKVVRWAILSLAPPRLKSGEAGVVSDPLAVSAMIKRLMTSSDIKGKNVIVSISNVNSLSHILKVTDLPGGLTTQEAVLEAAEDIMPSAKDRLYLSWQTIATGADGHRVLFVGIPRDLFDSEMQAFKAAGIKPYLIDLKTMALARAVNKEQALILNIEPFSFDIVIVVDGIPEIMCSLPWRQEDLTVEDKVEHLAVNLGLTVGFYNSSYPGTPLNPATPLTITGQMSDDPDLMEKLQGRVVYPIEPLAPPLEFPAHLPVSQYAVNIGLALKRRTPTKVGAKRGSHLPPDINLLPENYRPWRPTAKQLYIFCFIIVAIALLFPLYQATSKAMDKTADLQMKYSIINAELQKRQLEIKNRTPMQKSIDGYNAIVNMGDDFTDDLRFINSQAAALGVQVDSIIHQGMNITVNCRTEPESYITFRKYVSVLKENERFATVTPPPEGFSYTTGGTIKIEVKKSK